MKIWPVKRGTYAAMEKVLQRGCLIPNSQDMFGACLINKGTYDLTKKNEVTQ